MSGSLERDNKNRMYLEVHTKNITVEYRKVKNISQFYYGEKKID